MKEAYTTGELKALFAVSAESSILRRAEREDWQNRKRKTRGGGKEWLFASMPQDMRLAIQTAEARQAIAQEQAHLPVPLDADLLGLDSSSMAAMHPEYHKLLLVDTRRNKALAKADLVRQYTNWQRKFGFTVAQKQAFVLAYLGGAWPKLLAELGKLSWKSLENWKLALADKRGIARKGQTLLTEQHTVIILGQYLNPNKPNVAQCSRRIMERCKAEGLWIPSEPTIRRFVRAYAAECHSEYTFWREGKKAWNDKCAISILRDWNLVRVGDVLFADGHTLNFETLDPDTGKAKRMTLLLFYDGASNCPLGWEIMATENTACIASAFRRACIMLGKFPKVVYIDNGKAFRAKFFEHTPDFDQAGMSGLYTSLGCEVIHAWPYHGQSKTIERFFGSFQEMEVFIPSYTGNSIAAKPARMMRGEVMHRKLYEKMDGRPLTLEETHKAVALWFAEYARRPQCRTHLAGRSPGEVLEAGRGPGLSPEDTDRMTLLMMRKEIKTISKDGIRHRGRFYWHEALANRRHPVVVLYDDLRPQDIIVYTQDGLQRICIARDRVHYGIAAGIHPVARVLGTAEQQEDFRKAVELKKHQEKGATAVFQAMLETSILPEMQQRQAALEMPKATVLAFTPEPKQRQLTTEEQAVFAAAQEKAERQNALEADPNYYEPAYLQRFKDEAARYDYSFKIKHEKGIELVPQDEAWMQAYESSPAYERYYRRRYEDLKETYAMWKTANA